MEEGYKSPNFNSYNGEQSEADKDPCSLYIKNVPANFSKDAFHSKFCEYGTIVKLKLFKPLKRPGTNFTCGLVRYETAAEATLAIRKENGKPPLNLIITYSNNNSNNNSHNATSQDLNMNFATRDQHTSASSRTLGIGRGQPAQAELIKLQVQVDGNKRVAFQLPELIQNLCLACKKPGEYYCKNCIRPYCSPACQHDNWTSHKSICKPFLVRYETAAEATLAIREENGIPPLNPIITHSNNNSHYATSQEVNINFARRDQRTSASSRTLGIGRGLPAQAELIRLQVQVDGNKRVVFQLPELIQNLCLACKKPGEYCCKNCIRPYCSPACQHDDWTSHESICKPFSERRENGPPQHQIKCEAVSSMSEGSDEAERKITHLPTRSYTVIGVENSTDLPIIKVHQPVMFTSIERKSLPLNEVRTVFFIHKENDVMFLQDINDAARFKEIHTGAQECASSKVISHNPIVGELLCAQSDSDGEWYRCCIEEIVDADRYKIHYIDFGNSEVVSKKNLRYLSSSLAKDPSFGIAVKIIGQPTVELVKPYNVIAVSELVNNIQDVNLLLDVEEACNVPAHEVVSKDEPIPPFLYDSLDSISLETGEQDVILHTVLEDDNMLVLYCAPFHIKRIEANHALTNEITKYCSRYDWFSYNGDSWPVTSEMVLALSPSDKKWHRATVANADKHPFYEVSFVDHGEYTTLHGDYMRKMEKRFMTLPMQSVMCMLKGFKVTCEDTIIEEINKLIPFGKPEPQRAIVTLVPGDWPDIEIPAITNYLVEKGLAAVDRS